MPFLISVQITFWDSPTPETLRLFNRPRRGPCHDAAIYYAGLRARLYASYASSHAGPRACPIACQVPPQRAVAVVAEAEGAGPEEAEVPASRRCRQRVTGTVKRRPIDLLRLRELFSRNTSSPAVIFTVRRLYGNSLPESISSGTTLGGF